MIPYAELNSVDDDLFQRTVGLPRACFFSLVEKVKDKINTERSINPVKKRGLKGEFSIENKLLVTLYYLRHYPTLEVLAGVFKISKSYVHKIYHKYSTILVDILRVGGPKSLSSDKIETVLMDVTEQPIERPKRGQKDYYSGKKTTHHQSPANSLCCKYDDFVCCL